MQQSNRVPKTRLAFVCLLMFLLCWWNCETFPKSIVNAHLFFCHHLSSQWAERADFFFFFFFGEHFDLRKIETRCDTFRAFRDHDRFLLSGLVCHYFLVQMTTVARTSEARFFLLDKYSLNMLTNTIPDENFVGVNFCGAIMTDMCVLVEDDEEEGSKRLTRKSVAKAIVRLERIS